VRLGLLRIVALVTSLLMLAAFISATLGSVLRRTASPGVGLQLYLPLTLFGALPFLVAAILITLAVWGLGAAATTRSHRLVTLIRKVAAWGLLPMAIGGFWAGVGLGFSGIETNSPAAGALAVYEVTFLAALAADIVLLIVARRV
jgi:hypothetical protein